MNSLMTYHNPRQKFVLQGTALVTLGVLFIPLWNVLKNIHISDVKVSAGTRVSDPLSSLFNDLYLFLSISFLAMLLGVMCALYLKEWLVETNWIRRLVENQVNILSGIPSLLYGLLAVTIFLPYSGVLKKNETALSTENMDTVSLKTTTFQGDTTLFYATAVVFVLLVMPRVIKATQGALGAVPISIRESAYALGASQWQVLIKHVVPIAFSWILAGGCRAMSCAFATAALFIGVSIWGHTTHSGQMPGGFVLFLDGALFINVSSIGPNLGKFVLFLGGALLLSFFSTFLTERYLPVQTRHA